MAIFTCDGFQKTFAFPFDYLRKSFVKVRIGQTVLTLDIDYTVVNKQVELMNPPARDATITIYRETTTKRLVSWEDASALRAADMTLFEVQLLHILEETMDNILETCLTLDTSDTTWDAMNRRMKNLAPPVNPQDGVSKEYLESTASGFYQEMERLLSEMTDNKDLIENLLRKVTEIVSSVSVTLNPIMLGENEPVAYDEHTVWFRNVGNTLPIDGHDILFLEIE